LVPFNTQPVATITGAQIVNIYDDLATDVTDWVSPFDGFHLTEAGYQEMARVWFSSIQTAFELPPLSPPTPTISAAHARASLGPLPTKTVGDAVAPKRVD
jgi:hypothetical protein